MNIQRLANVTRWSTWTGLSVGFHLLAIAGLTNEWEVPDEVAVPTSQPRLEARFIPLQAAPPAPQQTLAPAHLPEPDVIATGQSAVEIAPPDQTLELAQPEAVEPFESQLEEPVATEESTPVVQEAEPFEIAPTSAPPAQTETADAPKPELLPTTAEASSENFNEETASPQEARLVEQKPVAAPSLESLTGNRSSPANNHSAAEPFRESGPDALVNPAPPYPRAALARNMTGVVWLTVQLHSNGTPRMVDVLKSSGHRLLDNSARRTVLQKWQFATGGGQADKAIVRIDFRIE